jgi:predicted Holliday junction resolvase-like endonuclease
MSWLAPGLARVLVSLSLGVTVALAAGALWQALDRLNDRAEVARHETATTASVREAELTAEREANRQDEIRRETREAQTEALRRAREDAIDESPSPVVAGPAVRAVLRELRTQADQDRRATR